MKKGVSKNKIHTWDCFRENSLGLVPLHNRINRINYSIQKLKASIKTLNRINLFLVAPVTQPSPPLFRNLSGSMDAIEDSRKGESLRTLLAISSTLPYSSAPLGDATPAGGSSLHRTGRQHNPAAERGRGSGGHDEHHHGRRWRRQRGGERTRHPRG